MVRLYLLKIFAVSHPGDPNEDGKTDKEIWYVRIQVSVPRSKQPSIAKPIHPPRRLRDPRSHQVAETETDETSGDVPMHPTQGDNEASTPVARNRPPGSPSGHRERSPRRNLETLKLKPLNLLLFPCCCLAVVWLHLCCFLN